jgi:hypothetical protein
MSAVQKPATSHQSCRPANSTWPADTLESQCSKQRQLFPVQDEVTNSIWEITFCPKTDELAREKNWGLGKAGLEVEQ